MQVERERVAIPEYSSVRVSNTWIIYLLVGNTSGKPETIPHKPARGKRRVKNDALEEESAAD